MAVTILPRRTLVYLLDQTTLQTGDGVRGGARVRAEVRFVAAEGERELRGCLVEDHFPCFALVGAESAGGELLGEPPASALALEVALVGVVAFASSLHALTLFLRLVDLLDARGVLFLPAVPAWVGEEVRSAEWGGGTAEVFVFAAGLAGSPQVDLLGFALVLLREVGLVECHVFGGAGSSECAPAAVAAGLEVAEPVAVGAVAPVLDPVTTRAAQRSNLLGNNFSTRPTWSIRGRTEQQRAPPMDMTRDSLVGLSLVWSA